MADAIVWWLTIEVLGLVALPVAAVLLGPLPERGYAVSKVLGLLLVMWLAGHSINYYYFGYVLMAGLTSLSGVPSQVAFNLANVALFALTALAAFGFAYNLIAGSLARLVIGRVEQVPTYAEVKEPVR